MKKILIGTAALAALAGAGVVYAGTWLSSIAWTRDAGGCR